MADTYKLNTSDDYRKALVKQLFGRNYELKETTPIPREEIIKKEGHKDDAGKARYDLLPPELMEGVADILEFGARKYSDRNWEKGMDWSRPFGALMRHMWKWWGGENNDPETGKSHLWHAGCCIAFLIAYEQRKVGNDNRPRL